MIRYVRLLTQLASSVWKEIRYHRELKLAAAFSLIFSLALLLFMYSSHITGSGRADTVKENQSEVAAAREETSPACSLETTGNPVCVHVAGHVKNPGVYFLPEGARVTDAISKAVPETDANLDFLNLAMPLEDGIKIYVPSNDEVKKIGWPLTGINLTQAGSKASSVKVNLNTCTREGLEQIPGIGEKTAEKIIELREKKHGFKSVEELKEVQGIGEKKFEQIKQYVFVVN